MTTGSCSVQRSHKMYVGLHVLEADPGMGALTAYAVAAASESAAVKHPSPVSRWGTNTSQPLRPGRPATHLHRFWSSRHGFISLSRSELTLLNRTRQVP